MEASNEREDEKETHNPLIPIDTKIINMSKSVCKINTKEKDGTGFLIKLFKDNKEFYSLMTNEHVITKKMIEAKEKIIIYYDIENEYREITLDKDERFIKDYKNIDIDITLIEILKKDKINKKYFLLPHIGDNNLINKNICIIQFPHGNLSYSKGKITKINKYEITYDVSTKAGSSGSPIFLENTKLVLGIHKQGNNKKMENYGDLLYPIIIDLKPKIDYKDGSYYKGDIINGISHGKGILYGKDGNIKYEGDFINNKFEGYGIYFFKDGGWFKGQLKNNLRHGKGIDYDENGNIEYEGDFIKDKFEGFGKLYYKNGNIKYEGNFIKGEIEGYGKLYYENGNIEYEAEFINGIIEGQGKYYWENGDYYIGQWKNGLRHGKGIEYYKNGKIMYEGNFINNKREGY